MLTTGTQDVPPLPGLDCGLCGMRTCDELARRLPERPDLLERCIPLSGKGTSPARREPVPLPARGPAAGRWPRREEKARWRAGAIRSTASSTSSSSTFPRSRDPAR